MALIKCKHCKKEISPNAKTCIHCGEPVEKVEVAEVEAVQLKDDGTEKIIKRIDRASLLLFIILIINTAFNLLYRGLQNLYYVSDFGSLLNALANTFTVTINSLVLTIFYPVLLHGLSHIIRLLEKKTK